MSSVLGKVPAPYYTSYAAAKHGVTGLSVALRQELAQEDKDAIHVCTLLPTSTDTPFFDHAANYTGHEATPIPPLYEAEDVVERLVELVTDPQDEVAGGKAALASKRLAPQATDKMMGKQTHRAQMEKAAAAADRPRPSNNRWKKAAGSAAGA